MRRDTVGMVLQRESAAQPAEIGRHRFCETEFQRDRIRLDGGRFDRLRLPPASSSTPTSSSSAASSASTASPASTVFRGRRIVGHLDAARMQFVGNGQIVERNGRLAAPALRGLLRRHEQVVEQRCEIAVRAGARDCLPSYPIPRTRIVVLAAHRSRLALKFTARDGDEFSGILAGRRAWLPCVMLHCTITRESTRFRAGRINWELDHEFPDRTVLPAAPRAQPHYRAALALLHAMCKADRPELGVTAGSISRAWRGKSPP